MQSRELKHEQDLSRYSLWIDGALVGLADYRLQGNSIVFTHTEIDPNKRHGGLGGVLIQGALDDVAQSTTLTVIPACPFVAEWIDTHPEYAELVSRTGDTHEHTGGSDHTEPADRND